MATDPDFPPRLLAIFYSVFDDITGPKILHRCPLDFHFDFDSISEYVIPKRQHCNKLVSLSTGEYRIIGYPTCLIDQSKYPRNALIFNLCVVLEEGGDTNCYIDVVRRLARNLKALEEQTAFLSDEGKVWKLWSIMDQLLEDLNNYCECMIPIDDENIINIKLFPTYRTPQRAKAWQVPICTSMTKLKCLAHEMVVPFIDGINSVKRISELADVELALTKKCMEHLLYYNCLIMVDIFQFSNCYTVLHDISNLEISECLQAECVAYTSNSHSPSTGIETILNLYKSLHQEITIRQWIAEHRSEVKGIDIRRFISFGVIKGFLYRVMKYPVLLNPTSQKVNSLTKFANGNHHMDEICTEFECSLVEAQEALEQLGVEYVYK
ncbi:Nitrogen permease regulator 2 [Neolecta irregularis DAH-3]|uniref:Nitrogen permease regulator 2 n=1 Tax=Neolecta irregularis (strain DAH-3) TaxID=1198029 RepID=A0A1U7LWX1_NEOID|nr:Nitrogen permease regulator 2 [Neolecta irregularis DAH-3]|eukprot:OLL27134.1 Nitrogen permease regulator 2 [Neolecta irregularis DAH-3]